VRARAVLARVMAVLAKHEHLAVRVEYVVGEIGALILLIADVLEHLELQSRRPFAFEALRRDL
jgi:hypothetical protein